MLLNNLYWELQLYQDNNNYSYLLSNYKSIISVYDFEFRKIVDGSCFLKSIDKISCCPLKQLTHHVMLPLNPDITITNILLHKIKFKDSATRPMIIPCITTDNKIYTILTKSENVRKDQIIMNIINLMEYVVKLEEKIDLELVKYNI